MTTVLRNGMQVCVANNALLIRGRRECIIDAPWTVDHIELSLDGAYLLAFGESMHYARIWRLETGKLVHEVDGERAHGLHGGLCIIDDVPYAFLALRDRQLSIIDLRDGSQRARLSTTGLSWFQVIRVVDVGSNWVGVQGHIKGESKDSILVFPGVQALTDESTLMRTLVGTTDGFLTCENIRDAADRVSVGPAGPGHVAIFREPDRDDEPDDPNDAFRGIVRWNLETRSVVDRVPCVLDLPENPKLGVTSTIGGNDIWFAVEAKTSIEVLDIASSTRRAFPDAVLDPYRMELARVDGENVVIEPIGALRIE